MHFDIPKSYLQYKLLFLHDFQQMFSNYFNIKAYRQFRLYPRLQDFKKQSLMSLRLMKCVLQWFCDKKRRRNFVKFRYGWTDRCVRSDESQLTDLSTWMTPPFELSTTRCATASLLFADVEAYGEYWRRLCRRRHLPDNTGGLKATDGIVKRQ